MQAAIIRDTDYLESEYKTLFSLLPTKGKLKSISDDIEKLSIFYPHKTLVGYYPIAVKNAPRPSKMSKSQYNNYLAIQLLEELGNDSPTQLAIDYIESFVKCYSTQYKIG
ncbi:MAG TPA: hypothetical protein VHE99_00385 [Gammaproteobacteria bacterium]|nr:hypothetical protein [Gammaproteobacteria bacterium]